VSWSFVQIVFETSIIAEGGERRATNHPGPFSAKASIDGVNCLSFATRLM